MPLGAAGGGVRHLPVQHAVRIVDARLRRLHDAHQRFIDDLSVQRVFEYFAADGHFVCGVRIDVDLVVDFFATSGSGSVLMTVAC